MCLFTRHNTTEVSSPLTWADIDEVVHSYYNHLNIIPDFFPMETSMAPTTPPTVESSAAEVFANSHVTNFLWMGLLSI
ncbi:unnamed protein product [Rhizophagus irregularis]|nr:unnamed protein product [Rhizophagus irregularis]